MHPVWWDSISFQVLHFLHQFAGLEFVPRSQFALFYHSFLKGLQYSVILNESETLTIILSTWEEIKLAKVSSAFLREGIRFLADEIDVKIW